MTTNTQSFRLIIVIFSLCAICYGMTGILLEDGGMVLAWYGVEHGQWQACLHSLSVMIGCIGLLVALSLAIHWHAVWAAPNRLLNWASRAISHVFSSEDDQSAYLATIHDSTDHPHLDSPLGENTLHFAKGSFQADKDDAKGGGGGGGRRPSPLNGNSEAGNNSPNPTSTNMRRR